MTSKEIKRIIELVKENNQRNNAEIVSSLLALGIRLEVLEKENKELKETIEIRKQMNINLIDFGTKLKQENEKLKQQVEDLENNQETVLTTLEIAVQENEKLKKAIEILKKHLHVKELDIDYVLDFNGLYGNHLTKPEYELLKEVLYNE